MQLTPEECRLFYKLHPALMFFANRKLRVITDEPADPQEHALLPPEKRLEVRDALHAKPDLIDQFLQENPSGFNPDELEIVRSWKHAVVGSFYIFRYLKGYAVFLSSEKVPKAYGVLALADPLEERIGPCLPRLIQTVLLPFKGKIVYDGLLSGYNLTFGGVLYGDPQLLCEGFEDDPEVVDSLRTKLSTIIPEDGKRFRFEYEYDFGDGWEHEILFEGCLKAEKGTRYPLCLEGARACPPEDVGGIGGYYEYVKAMADPKHKRHREFMEWQGPFDPEAFDTEAVTKRMRRGLPKPEEDDWI